MVNGFKGGRTVSSARDQNHKDYCPSINIQTMTNDKKENVTVNGVVSIAYSDTNIRNHANSRTYISSKNRTHISSNNRIHINSNNCHTNQPTYHNEHKMYPPTSKDHLKLQISAKQLSQHSQLNLKLSYQLEEEQQKQLYQQEQNRNDRQQPNDQQEQYRVNSSLTHNHSQQTNFKESAKQPFLQLSSDQLLDDNAVKYHQKHAHFQMNSNISQKYNQISLKNTKNNNGNRGHMSTHSNTCNISTYSNNDTNAENRTKLRSCHGHTDKQYRAISPQSFQQKIPNDRLLLTITSTNSNITPTNQNVPIGTHSHLPTTNSFLHSVYNHHQYAKLNAISHSFDLSFVSQIQSRLLNLATQLKNQLSILQTNYLNNLSMNIINNNIDWHSNAASKNSFPSTRNNEISNINIDSISQYYHGLAQIINNQAESSGPKRFKHIIDGIAFHMLQLLMQDKYATTFHSANLNQSSKIPNSDDKSKYSKSQSTNKLIDKDDKEMCSPASFLVLVHLVFYHRHCQNLLTSVARLNLLAIEGICNLRMNKPQAALEKVMAARKIHKPIPQLEAALIIIQARAYAMLGKSRDAKGILRSQLSKLIILTNEVKKDKSTVTALYTMICVSCFTLGWLSQLTQQTDMSAYHATKSLEIAQKHLGPQASSYIAWIKNKNKFAITKKVKLSQVQAKLQLKIGPTLLQPASSNKSLKKKALFKSQSNELLLSDKVSKQLTNLLDVRKRSPNYNELKKTTLNLFKGKKRAMTKEIEENQKQISKMEEDRRTVTEKKESDTRKLQEENMELKKKEEIIKMEMLAYRQKHLSVLKSVKIFQKYIRGVLTEAQFVKDKNLYAFSEGRVLSEGVIRAMNKFKILSDQVKAKNPLNEDMTVQEVSKRVVKRFCYSNIEHIAQFQTLVHYGTPQKTYKYRIVIYPLQIGPNVINGELDVDQELHEKLMLQPLHYNISKTSKGIVLLKNQLAKVSYITIYSIKYFCKLLRQRIQRKVTDKLLKKIYYRYIDSRYLEREPMIFFIVATKIGEIQSNFYNVHLERIDDKVSINPLFNVKVNYDVEMEATSQTDFTPLVDSIYRAELHKKFAAPRLEGSIVRIQKFFRSTMARITLGYLKKAVNVEIEFIGDCIYTLKKEGKTMRTLFIENISKGQFAKYLNPPIETLDILKLLHHKFTALDCEKKMEAILKYLKIRLFFKKVLKRASKISYFKPFESQFSERLVFAKIFTSFLYKNSTQQGRIMAMMTIKDRHSFPRAYSLRVFTIDHESLLRIDAVRTVFEKEKRILETSLERINECINLITRTQLTILSNVTHSRSNQNKLRRQSNSNPSQGAQHGARPLSTNARVGPRASLLHRNMAVHQRNLQYQFMQTRNNCRQAERRPRQKVDRLSNLRAIERIVNQKGKSPKNDQELSSCQESKTEQFSMRQLSKGSNSSSSQHFSRLDV